MTMWRPNEPAEEVSQTFPVLILKDTRLRSREGS